MAKTEDFGAFNLITVDNFSKPQAFRDVARTVVNADTLTDFLRRIASAIRNWLGNSARPKRGDPAPAHP